MSDGKKTAQDCLNFVMSKADNYLLMYDQAALTIDSAKSKCYLVLTNNMYNNFRL